MATETLVCPKCGDRALLYTCIETSPGDFDEDTTCTSCGHDPLKMARWKSYACRWCDSPDDIPCPDCTEDFRNGRAPSKVRTKMVVEEDPFLPF